MLLLLLLALLLVLLISFTYYFVIIVIIIIVIWGSWLAMQYTVYRHLARLGLLSNPSKQCYIQHHEARHVHYPSFSDVLPYCYSNIHLVNLIAGDGPIFFEGTQRSPKGRKVKSDQVSGRLVNLTCYKLELLHLLVFGCGIFLATTRGHGWPFRPGGCWWSWWPSRRRELTMNSDETLWKMSKI